ncbi:MAG: CHASE domain-containing protein [Proteobacteria bacterium]|nr:CHASE domain-containing protein [Pseudomonadota bacterium]
MPADGWSHAITIGGRKFPYAPAILVAALLYFLCARLGLAFATLQESASPVWPASGLAVALLILAGPRAWPAVAIGALFANALTGGWASALFITVGNTLEAVLGLLIYQRIAAIGASQLPIARSAGFVLAALAAPVASAGTGVITLGLQGVLGEASIGSVFATWWSGDVLGILVLAPALLSFTPNSGWLAGDLPASFAMPNKARFIQLRQAAILAAFIFGSTAVSFLPDGWIGGFFLILPTLLLSARWFGSRGISATLLLTGALWLSGTAAGIGPFSDQTINDSMLNAQIMLGAIAITGLILADVDYVRSPSATVVFIGGAVIAASIFLVQHAKNAAVDERHLITIAKRMVDDINHRLDSYVDTLRGGTAYVTASTDVTRWEWRSYVDSLDIGTRLPGLLGVGVILPVDPSSLKAFAAQLAHDGVASFKLKTVPGTQQRHDQHFVIVFAEPEDINGSAIGLDIATEAVRRNAAIAARDTGKAQLSARITLVQDPKHRPGFLLLLPMYREPTGNKDSKALRWSFHGWVYAPIIAEKFFEDALLHTPDELELRVLDGSDPARGERLFQWQPNDRQLAAFRTEYQTRINLLDHEVTLQWGRAPDFDATGYRMPTLFGAGIILFSALLAALVGTLMSQRERANAIARQMNAALATGNERLELAAACTRDGIWDYDAKTGTVWRSPRYAEIYGYTEADISDHWDFWRSIILPEDATKSDHQYQQMLAGERDGIDLVQRYRHRDGHIVHIHSRAIAVRDEAGRLTRVIGVHTDISLVVLLEQQFKDAVNVMRDGFGLFDENDRLLIFNEAFIDEGTRKAIGDPTGCTFEEVVRAFVEHDMPDARDPTFDREAWIARRMELHRNPPSQPIEVKWSGERWMRISERRTSTGGYVGIWADVTEIKRLGQLFHDAVSVLPDAFAIFGPDDRLLICNDSYITPKVRAALGGPIGHRYQDLYDAYAELELGMTDRDKRAQWVAERVTRHRNPSEEPYEVMTADHHVLRVIERRTTSGCIVGLWSDITALRQAERRLNDAIASINEGFVLLDSDMRYVVFNDEFLRLYPKMAPHVKVGGRFEDALRAGAAAGEYPDLETPMQIEAFIAEWSNRYRDPAAYQGEGAFADGRWVLIGHRGTSDGGCVNVYTDITAIKQRETDLAAAKQRLETQAIELIALTEDLRNARQVAVAANISKSRFLADMSHELRTPLNGILGFAEIIKEQMFGEISPPQYREYAADIHASGLHLLRLINDLLDLSKIEAERMTLTIDAIETSAVVGQTVRLVENLARERDVTLDASDIAGCPVLHADERQARQILLNLLSNAIKFTPDGGSVTLRCVDDGEMAVITVKDTGIGMTEAEVKKAMERFGQAEAGYSKKTLGTGLGLPLVDGLVKLHGGSLTIDSTKNVGTTVTVRLPWRDDLYRPHKIVAAS